MNIITIILLTLWIYLYLEYRGMAKILYKLSNNTLDVLERILDMIEEAKK